MFTFGLILGLLVGGMAGVLTMALVQMSARNEYRIETEARDRGLY